MSQVPFLLFEILLLNCGLVQYLKLVDTLHSDFMRLHINSKATYRTCFFVMLWLGAGLYLLMVKVLGKIMEKSRGEKKRDF